MKRVIWVGICGAAMTGRVWAMGRECEPLLSDKGMLASVRYLAPVRSPVAVHPAPAALSPVAPPAGAPPIARSSTEGDLTLYVASSSSVRDNDDNIHLVKATSPHGKALKVLGAIPDVKGDKKRNKK